MSMRSTISAAAGMCMFVVPAQAEETDIRAAIDALRAAVGAEHLVIGVEPEIAARADGFDVLFPELALVENGEDGIVVELSPLSAFLRPTAENTYEMTASLPPTIRITEEGLEEALLTLGGQSLSGTFDAALGIFTSLDVAMSDLRLTPGADALAAGESAEDGITLARLSAKVDLDEEADGLWNASAAIELRDLAAVIEATPILSLGSMSWETEVWRLTAADLPAMAEDAGTIMSPMEALELSEDMDGAFGGLRWAFALDDMEGRDPETGDMFSLAQGEAWFDLSDLDRDRAAIQAGFVQTGLRVESLELPPALIPEDLSLAISLDNVPGLPVWAAQRDLLDADPMAALGILVEAGTSLALHSASNAELGGFLLDGRIDANPDSFMGASGHVTLDVREWDGLEAMLAEADPDAAAFTELLSAFAQPVEETGHHRFHLELTPEGVLSLNGESLDEMLAAFGVF